MYYYDYYALPRATVLYPTLLWSTHPTLLYPTLTCSTQTTLLYPTLPCSTLPYLLFPTIPCYSLPYHLIQSSSFFAPLHSDPFQSYPYRFILFDRVAEVDRWSTSGMKIRGSNSVTGCQMICCWISWMRSKLFNHFIFSSRSPEEEHEWMIEWLIE